MSFRLKTILGVALIEMTLLAVLVWNGMNMMRHSSEDQLVQRAQTTSALFASMVKDGVLSYDLATLETFVTELMKNEGIVYVRIYDQEQLLASAGEQHQLAVPFREDLILESVDDAIFDVKAGIVESGVHYGRVELGISTQQLEQKLADAAWKTSSLAITEIILSALFSFFLGSWLVRQLEVLRHASSEIASGKLGVQIPVTGSDEIAETAHHFNQMSSALQRSTDELNRLNASLEGQVAERTEQLEIANQSLQSILQSMSEILLVVDDCNQIQITNPASQRLLGYEERLLISQDVRILLESDEDQRRLEQLIREENKLGEEFSLLTASGERLPVLMMASRVDSCNGDGVCFTVITAQDLRELKRAEEGERYRSFQEGLNEMSASILHNLGNNLAGIGGELMRIEQQSSNLKKIASVLQHFSSDVLKEMEGITLQEGGVLQKVPAVLTKSGDSIEHIVTNEIEDAVSGVGDLTRHIESVIRATPLSEEGRKQKLDFELANLLEDVEVLLAELIEEKRIEFLTQISLRVERLHLSRNLLLQAMLHLVTNSIESIEGESGQIEVMGDQYQDEGGESWLYLQVLDNGSGIDEALLKQVLKAGFSTKHGGSGNGLHAVGNYINALGGKMTIENRGDGQKGVRVALSLPL